jgi:hypothetical protein
VPIPPRARGVVNAATMPSTTAWSNRWSSLQVRSASTSIQNRFDDGFASPGIAAACCTSAGPGMARRIR